MKLDFGAKWPEIGFISLLVLGFIMALVTRNPIINYLTIFFAGIIIGKLFLVERLKKSFFFYVVTSGFVFGYLFGSFRASRVVSFLFLIFGMIVSIYVIKDKI